MENDLTPKQKLSLERIDRFVSRAIEEKKKGSNYGLYRLDEILFEIKSKYPLKEKFHYEIEEIRFFIGNLIEENRFDQRVEKIMRG